MHLLGTDRISSVCDSSFVFHVRNTRELLSEPEEGHAVNTHISIADETLSLVAPALVGQHN